MQGNYTRYLMNQQRAAIEQARAVALPKTGHAGNGGLQNHSLGETYPFVAYGRQVGDELRWGVQNAVTGEDTGPLYRDAATAEKVARDKKYIG